MLEAPEFVPRSRKTFLAPDPLSLSLSLLSVYISSYKELNPSKSQFCLGHSPRNAGLVWGALIAGE